MTLQSPFSPVALAYATHIAELDAAKAVFDAERGRLVDELVEVLNEVTSVQPEREGKNRTYVSCYMEDSRWTDARRARAKRGCSAGFTFAIDRLTAPDSGDQLSFAAYVFFQMGRPAFNLLPTAITAAPELQFTFGSGYARGWHRVFRVESPEFSIKSMQQAVREIPGLFAELDDRITAAYERARPIGAPGTGDGAQDEEDG